MPEKDEKKAKQKKSFCFPLFIMTEKRAIKHLAHIQSVFLYIIYSHLSFFPPYTDILEEFILSVPHDLLNKHRIPYPTWDKFSDAYIYNKHRKGYYIVRTFFMDLWKTFTNWRSSTLKNFMLSWPSSVLYWIYFFKIRTMCGMLLNGYFCLIIRYLEEIKTLFSVREQFSNIVLRFPSKYFVFLYWDTSPN